MVLQNYFGPEQLSLAWQRVKALLTLDDLARDHAGVDLFQRGARENIDQLSALLINGEYKPTRPIKFYEPKATGTLRVKTILCIEDAIVYQCMIDAIAEECHEILSPLTPHVFGNAILRKNGLVQQKEKSKSQVQLFEPWQKSRNQFVVSLNSHLKGHEYQYKLEADITSFFDSIPHSVLLYGIHKKTNLTKEFIDFLGVCLNVWSGTADSVIPGIGIPQGPIPSQFLANLYLSDLDKIILTHCPSYHRYVDDIHILSSEEQALNRLLVKIDSHLKSIGLHLNTAKTKIRLLKEDRKEEELELIDFQSYDGDISEKQEVSIDGKLTQDPKKTQSRVENDIFQTHHESVFSSKDSAVEYYHRQLKLLRTEIDSLVRIGSDGTVVMDDSLIEEARPEKVWIRLGRKCRILFDFSRELDLGIEPDYGLIKVWFAASKQFHWKANQFNYILRCYGVDDNIKSQLIECISESTHLEWVQYHYITTLGITQECSPHELQFFIDELDEDKTVIQRWAIYQLLILQLEPSHPMFRQTIGLISKEKSAFLKSTMIYKINNKSGSILSRFQLAKEWGLL